MSDEFSKKENINKKSAYIYGAILGLAATVAAMFAFSAVLLFLNLDRTFAAPFATISVAFGCFAASHRTAEKIGNKGYVVGIIIGISVFVLITILSLVAGNRLSLNTVFHFVIMMLSSLVGGISGVNRTRHKKYI